METVEDRLKGVPPRLVILAACAFARSVEHLLTDQRSRDAIQTAERFADGQATAEEVRAVSSAAWAAREPAAQPEGAWVATWAVSVAAAVAAAADAAVIIAEAARAARAASAAVGVVEKAASNAAWAEAAELAEVANQAVLDCLLPPRIESTFPPHVKGLATLIYEKRDWPLMLVLADALEELGYTDFAQHCRQPIHARGCHVLDSILGLGTVTSTGVRWATNRSHVPEDGDNRGRLVS